MQAYKSNPNEKMRIVRADVYRKYILLTGLEKYVGISEFLFHFQHIEYSDVCLLVRDLESNGYLHQIEDANLYLFYKTTIKGMWLLRIKLQNGFDIPMNSGYY